MTRPIRLPDLLVRFVLTALTHEGTLKLVRFNLSQHDVLT